MESKIKDALAQQEELQQELELQGELFRTLAERSPVPVVMTSMITSKAIYTNQATNDLFNNGEPLIGATAIDFYDNPADRAVMLTKLRAEGALHAYPMKMKHSDGSRAHYLMWMIPCKIGDEMLLFTYLLDVTKQKEAEGALVHRNEEMGLILGHVGEGLLMLDAHGVLQDERSAIVDRWLGKPQDRERFWDYAGKQDASFAQWFELGWEAIEDGLLPLELVLEQLPSLLRVEERFLKATYKAILGEHDVLERVLVILTDFTELVQRERAEEAQREMLGLFDQLLRDRAGVEEFFQEASILVEELCGDLSDELALRHIHTLKGNCGFYGLNSVAELCHKVEDEAKELGGSPSPEGISKLINVWESIAHKVNSFLDARPAGIVELETYDLDILKQALANGADRREVNSLIEQWKHEPTKRRLERIGSQVVSLGQRLERGKIKVVCEHNLLRLNAERWVGFWANFAHAIRNAIDHGLESPDDRLAAGKSEVGQITLVTRLDGDRFIIELKDDGRGISWDVVARKAKEKGLPHESHEALVDALFSDGLSTREVATAMSGRGVGLSALKAATLDLGGHIEVDSVKGEGTTFRFVFDKSARF